jgi:hypothetical protein
MVVPLKFKSIRYFKFRVIYDCKATYNTYNNGSILSSKFYFAEHQLSFPKSTGYGVSLVGDVKKRKM